MRQIFKHKDLEKQLLEDGYILISGFLSEDELSEFRKAYEQLQPDSLLNTTHSSYEGDNIVKRKAINTVIRKAIQRSVDNLYADYKPLTGVFIVKPPQSNTSKIKLHFDSNCVEEEECESTVLWVPLNEVNEKNGGLQVFKGSHVFMSKIRPFGAHFCYEKYYDFFENNFMTPIRMKAGDALIFLNRTLHFSNHNTSDTDRISFRIDLIPKEAHAIQYFNDDKTPKHKAKVYKIDDDYYERFTRDLPPGNEYYDRLKDDPFRELPKAELNKVIGKLNAEWNNKLKRYSDLNYFFKKIRRNIFKTAD